MDEITFHLLPPGAKWCHYPSYSILIRVIYFHHIFILYGNPPRGYLLTDWRSLHVSIVRNIERRHKFKMYFNSTVNIKLKLKTTSQTKKEIPDSLKLVQVSYIFSLWQLFSNKGIVKGMKRFSWHLCEKYLGLHLDKSDSTAQTVSEDSSSI